MKVNLEEEPLLLGATEDGMGRIRDLYLISCVILGKLRLLSVPHYPICTRKGFN